MNQVDTRAAQFPKRRSTHRGRWQPIYLEPIAGSGERLCIGVAAQDESTFVVEAVDNLNRLANIYGEPSSAFIWAAHLALGEIRHLLSSRGFEALSVSPPQIDGLLIGDVRAGAGTGLLDLARVAMRQVSSLASELRVPSEVGRLTSADGAVEEHSDVERRVKAQIRERRPDWRDKFGQRFRPSQSARAIRFGFVGHTIAANFGSLTSTIPRNTATQVDRSKARLWDLQQLRSGVLSDLFGAEIKRSHELLVFSPYGGMHIATGALNNANASILEAEEELKSEADRADIQFRPMASIPDIANYLLATEA